MSITTPIYFDYMATTPVAAQVATKMMDYLAINGTFGNPASTTHPYGLAANQAITHAREQVASLVNADPKEIIWTSGATESDNLALMGAARFYQRQGKHIVTLTTEHNAVLDPCRQLEKEGFTVSYLTPQANGLIDLNSLQAALRKDTILVSIMHVNNEIGVIQNIAAIGKLTRQHGILLHVDAAQSVGKLPIDLQKIPIDLMSFTAHKLYGPKGIGALFVRRKPRAVRLQPLIYGGGHENGLRSGTLATHQIVAMGEACQLAKQHLSDNYAHIKCLATQFLQGISTLDGITLNGDLEHRYPGNINFCISGVHPESLLLALRDLAISTGSACTSAHIEPSHVLQALGVPSELALNAIRLSLGCDSTAEEVDFAIKLLHKQIPRLRQMSP